MHGNKLVEAKDAIQWYYFGALQPSIAHFDKAAEENI